MLGSECHHNNLNRIIDRTRNAYPDNGVYVWGNQYLPRLAPVLKREDMGRLIFILEDLCNLAV